jgi:hypothetical protein
MTTAVRSPATRSPAVRSPATRSADPRGTGFRPTEPEAMGSVSGTYDLALADPEPRASGPQASGRIPGVTGATWI